MIMIGCVGCFFDIPSLLPVLLCTAFMFLAGYNFSDIGKYFLISFNNQPADEKDPEGGIIFFRALQRYLLLSGGIGAMMGLIFTRKSGRISLPEQYVFGIEQYAVNRRPLLFHVVRRVEICNAPDQELIWIKNILTLNRNT